jgi:hypothetical protein
LRWPATQDSRVVAARAAIRLRSPFKRDARIADVEQKADLARSRD